VKGGCVLVTGANGFLGQEIIRQLGDDYSLMATGRRLEVATHLDVDYIPVDLLSDDLGGRLPDHTDTILHVAGVTGGGAKEMARNLDMTRRLVDWGINVGVRNLVLISSAAVYAPSDQERTESFACHPQSAYGHSKLAAERYAIAACASAGMRLVILRKPAVLGSTRNGNIARLIGALARHRFVMIGNGSNEKSLISVKDAARACQSAVGRLLDQCPENAHRIFNVTGGTMSMMQIIDVVRQELGIGQPLRVPGGPITVPLKFLSALTMGASLFSVPLANIQQFQRNDLLDASLFSENAGIDPVVDIREALREMVRYQNLIQ
jgi:nucleoside-diphosphate-sugar epimerase